MLFISIRVENYKRPLFRRRILVQKEQIRADRADRADRNNIITINID